MIKIIRKKVITTFLAITLLLPTAGALGADVFAQEPASSAYGSYGGQIYYVDSVSGSDSNSGTGTESAWKSLNRVNQQEYQPGDQILFKSGGVFGGRLMPQGSGTEGKPIIIGKYGGEARPIINGSSNLLDGGNEGSTVLLYNQEYWEIYDLEITNRSSSSQASCMGIWVINKDFGTANHFVISGTYIHSLTFNARSNIMNGIRYNNGTVDTYTREGSPTGAIQISVLVGGKKVPSRFNDVQVVNNEVANVARTGFNLGSDWSDHQAHGYLDDMMEQLYFSTNIYVANNIFRNTGAAVTMFDVDGSIGRGCIVEKNVCYDNNNGNSYWVMWSAHTIDLVYQYNEIYNMYQTSGSDDGLFDADGQSVGTVFQYNYTHHNAGPVFVLCNIEWDPVGYPVPYVRSCAYRYNISYNDNWLGLRGKGTFFNVGDGNGLMYNNLIYTEDYDVILFDMYGSESFVSNNIFYSTGDGAVTYKCGGEGGQKTNVNNNCFYGLTSELPKDNAYTSASGNFKGDPKLALPTGMDTGNKSGIAIGAASIAEILSKGYFKLQPDSPCIGSGQVIPNNGGRDFFGNNLSEVSVPDIGPHQFITVGADHGTISLLGSEVTTDTMRLRWERSNKETSISKYEIYLNGELSHTIHSLHRKTADFDLLGPKEGNMEIFKTNSMRLEGLTPGTQYQIQVRAYSGDGSCIQSNTIDVTTKALAAGEEKLQLTELEVYKYDASNNTDIPCTDFRAEETIRFKTTVTDGAGRPVKGVAVHVVYEAKGLEYASYDVAVSDSNGDVWVGCTAPYLSKEKFDFTATVWSVEKDGYSFRGTGPSRTVGLHGFSEKYNENLLKNSDFAQVGTTLPSNWNYVGAGYISLVNTQGPQEKQNVLEFRSENAVSAQVRQSISYVPNGTYTLTAWVRNTNTIAKLGVSNTGNSKDITIPVSEEWTQVVLDNVSVSTNKIIAYITVPMFGNQDDYTQVCNVELTRNLLYNTDINVLHPTSKLELPADFYYKTANVTVNVGDTDFSAADQDENLQAVGVGYYEGENFRNALQISSNKPFDFAMGQKKTALKSGKYTFSASVSKAGQIKGILRIRDGVSGDVLNSTAIETGQRYEMVKVTAEVTSGSAYVELYFNGEGNGNEYINLLNMSFANRSDIAGDATMVVLPGQNLFDYKNGDFEDDNRATNTIPSGWVLNDYKGYVDAYVVDEDKHTGNYCMKLTLDEKGYHNIGNAQYSAGAANPADVFSNLPAGTYTFSVWIRTNFRMKYAVKADQAARSWEFYTVADDKWHEYVIKDITVKDGELNVVNWADRNIKENPKDGSMLYAYIDTLTLTKDVDTYISNGNAETVNAGRPVGWTVTEHTGHAELITTKECVEGERAAMAVLPGRDSSLTFFCGSGAVLSGTYNFSAKIRGNGAVKVLVETDGHAEPYTLQTTASQDWQEVRINKMRINGAVKGVSITVENQPGNTSSFVSFDDVSITEHIGAAIVAKQLPKVKGIELGESLVLPKPLVKGYTVSFYMSSDERVIDKKGKVVTPDMTKYVMVTLKVVNDIDPEDTAYVSKYVTVYGWE